MIGIYKITSPSGKIYIGQAVNIERRFKEYQNLNHTKYQIKLYNSFNKYGINNHIFEILEECDIEQLNERERYYQDLYDVLNVGLNCRLTTTNDKSGCLCEEMKIKLSIAGKGRKQTKEHILKKISSHIGSKRSDESKKLMSEKAKGRIFTEEHKLKLSISKTGGKRSEETKLKMSRAQIGRKFSETHKLNLSKSKSGGNHRDAKKVICTKTGIIWDCIKNCAKENKISYAYLKNRLNGKVKNETTLMLLINE